MKSCDWKHHHFPKVSTKKANVWYIKYHFGYYLCLEERLCNDRTTKICFSYIYQIGTVTYLCFPRSRQRWQSGNDVLQRYVQCNLQIAYLYCNVTATVWMQDTILHKCKCYANNSLVPSGKFCWKKQPTNQNNTPTNQRTKTHSQHASVTVICAIEC